MNPQERHQRAAAIIERFAKLWPQAFVIYERRRVPLKVGIDADLIAACAPAIDKGLISAIDIKTALGSYTSATGYLFACKVTGAARVGLDGKVAGVVTEGQAANAQHILERRRARKAAQTIPPQANKEGVPENA